MTGYGFDWGFDWGFGGGAPSSSPGKGVSSVMGLGRGQSEVIVLSREESADG